MDENKKKSLMEETWLSEREAEAYLLTEKQDFIIRKASEKMGVCPGRVKSIRHRIREKLKKSRETIDQIEL